MKINFTFETKYGVFRDALYLDDNHQLDDAEIDALKQERLNNWLSTVENPPEPSKETIEINGVIYEKIEVDGQTLLRPVEG